MKLSTHPAEHDVQDLLVHVSVCRSRKFQACGKPDREAGAYALALKIGPLHRLLYKLMCSAMVHSPRHAS